MLIRNFIFWLSTKRSVTDSIARRGMRHGFARRFVAGETLGEALTASAELCRQGRNVSLNHLGENVATEAAAREVCASYIEMVEQLHAKHLSGNISIKLTQLGLDLSKDLCAELALSIAKRAAGFGRTIEMDMEGSVYTEEQDLQPVAAAIRIASRWPRPGRSRCSAVGPNTSKPSAAQAASGPAPRRGRVWRGRRRTSRVDRNMPSS